MAWPRPRPRAGTGVPVTRGDLPTGGIDLNLDDQLRVTGADGAERTYRIVAREEWPKSRIPLEQYFDLDGGVKLTLITCGGPFDEATRNYRDNVVITAVPAA
jgi:hypothetical protein